VIGTAFLSRLRLILAEGILLLLLEAEPERAKGKHLTAKGRQGGL